MTKNEFIKKFGEEKYQSILERNRKNYQKSKDKWKATRKNYYENNKEHLKENMKEYTTNTKIGRAKCLLSSYRHNDLKYNRGECELDEDFILNHIFTQPCHYCDETDWRKLGCDRIDNTKPHTPENVVPCCRKCNLKRGKKDYSSFLLKNHL